MVDWNTKGYTDKNLEKIKILERNVLDLEKQLQSSRQRNHELKKIIEEAKLAADEIHDRYNDLMKGYAKLEEYYRKVINESV
jgi:predicted nuclease with TOPRIM domain